MGGGLKPQSNDYKHIIQQLIREDARGSGSWRSANGPQIFLEFKIHQPSKKKF